MPRFDNRKAVTSADFLAYHARLRPQAIAVEEQNDAITYARFFEDLRRLIRIFHDLGLASGDIAVIECDGLYHSWLLHIACECFGVATAHYETQQFARQLAPLIERTAIVFHHGVAPEGTHRAIKTDAAWWQNALANEPADLPHPPGNDAVCKIACSSGTTGAVKFIPQTFAALAFRMMLYEFRVPFTLGTRHLSNISFSVQPFFFYATMCLRGGGTCVSPGHLQASDMIARARPTNMLLLPMYFSPLMALTGPAASMTGIDISVVGGRVPNNIRERLLGGFARSILENYSTNEAGPVATMSADGTGVILPGVDVEIVDEDGKLCPTGTAGEIRIRSEGCAAGYLFDETATARMFRDGWFYPGDIGQIEGPNTLRLLGRIDDLINIRGVKVDAPKLEDELRRIAAVKDIGIVAAPLDEVSDMLWIAVIPEKGAPAEDLVETITNALPESSGKVRFFAVDLLPRTDTGKLQRHALTERLAAISKTGG
jgi:2,3-dihydroxybenzoate-AMP ligase